MRMFHLDIALYMYGSHIHINQELQDKFKHIAEYLDRQRYNFYLYSHSHIIGLMDRPVDFQGKD